jgi:NADH-quinone oxidoreductase subunit L
MFLGAGSVMHGMDDDVNMRHYGALSRAMPITFITFAAGYLAIIGFPFFSGFYSKDHIIEAAFERSALVGALAMLGAGVTAFYMTRLMLMTFLGHKRWLAGVHPHESPAVMTVPLIILGFFSFSSGLLLNNWISGWLDPAFGIAHTEEHAPSLLHVTPVGIATLLLVAVGAAIAFVVFGPRKDIPLTAPQSRSPFTLAGRNDLYGDALNEAVLMRPGQQLSDGLLRLEDDGIDGAVNGTGSVISQISGQLRKVQNGFVRSYALTMVLGAVVVGAVIALGRLG